MSSPRPLSAAKWRAIKKALLKNDYCIKLTATQQGVSERTVIKEFSNLRAERMGQVNRILNDVTSTKTSEAIYFGHKSEPYFETEKQMLAELPTYAATNRDRITPINPNWKLY